MSGQRGVVTLPDPMHLEGWEENDEPLATDPHSDEQAYCYYALRYLLNPGGHYVSKDRWLRMDPANPTDKLLPDLLIALGLQERQWGTDEYLPWEVGKAPEILAEFLSPSSETADKVQKPRRYGKLGVREYFLFDPVGTYRVPRIQGWTLVGEDVREVLPRHADGGVSSRIVPVRFVLADNHIVIIDTRTDELALRYEGLQHLVREEREARRREAAVLSQRLQQEAVARAQEAAAHEAAEREIKRLQAEVDRLRGARNEVQGKPE